MVWMRMHRRITTWLALLAVVLGALAPTVTQAMGAGESAPKWLEICSVTGMVWVQADTGQPIDQSPAENDHAASTPTCAWCLMNGAADVWPTVAWHLPASTRLTDHPPGYYQAPQTATVWLPAHSRAPPTAA